MFGVNWVWLLSMLGYESIWVVLIPVQITELIFPSQRSGPWLRTRGLITAGIAFVVGSFIAWYLWTQRARPMVYHVPRYQPPLISILLGATAVALLVAASFLRRPDSQLTQKVGRSTPQPWLVGLAGFFLAVPSLFLIGLAYGAWPGLPPWIAILGGIAWGIIALALIGRWVSSASWQDMHRLALSSGAVVASMLFGFAAGNWLRIDLIAKIVLDLFAVVYVAYLARVIRRRS